LVAGVAAAAAAAGALEAALAMENILRPEPLQQGHEGECAFRLFFCCIILLDLFISIAMFAFGVSE
jgi:hypothetical protein